MILGFIRIVTQYAGHSTVYSSFVELGFDWECMMQDFPCKVEDFMKEYDFPKLFLNGRIDVEVRTCIIVSVGEDFIGFFYLIIAIEGMWPNKFVKSTIGLDYREWNAQNLITVSFVIKLIDEVGFPSCILSVNQINYCCDLVLNMYWGIGYEFEPCWMIDGYVETSSYSPRALE